MQRVVGALSADRRFERLAAEAKLPVNELAAGACRRDLRARSDGKIGFCAVGPLGACQDDQARQDNDGSSHDVFLPHARALY